MTTQKTTILDLKDLQGERAIAVLDTSSLLMEGTKLLNHLSQCTVVIPSVVIDELEVKRTHATVGFFAREWLRLLETLRVNHRKALGHDGVRLDNYDNVILRVEPNHKNQETLPQHMRDGSNDSTILAVAKNLSLDTDHENDTIVVVSNDVPMRLKATLHLELEAVEYSPADVLRSDEVFEGTYTVELATEDLADGSFTANKLTKNVQDLVLEGIPVLEERSYHSIVDVQVENDDARVQARVSGDTIRPLQRKQRASNIVGRTFEQDAALEYLMDNSIDIVSLGGRAGTGKTLMALAAGYEQIHQGAYQKITVYKSLHEMGVGQELGFLPGGVDEKMEAWAGAIYDAIDVLATEKKSSRKKVKQGGDQADEAIKQAVSQYRSLMEVMPIAYLRGRSLSNTYIILEEAQNFSRAEILNIISRVGEGSKLVLTWDADQVDNKYLSSGEQSDIWTIVESMRTEDLFAHITLSRTERSRVSELASRLLANG